MNRADVKKAQAATINTAIFPNLNYLFRLRKRMQEVGFPHDDKLFTLVCAAYDAVYALHMETHYLSCDGVGNPTKKEEQDGNRPNT